MITGSVNARREATVTLSVRDADGVEKSFEAIIDTGYNGSLTLPTTLVAALGIPLFGQRRALLADGSERLFDVYAATIMWDGQPRDVLVNSSDSDPLLGMNLLYGYELVIHAVDGGRVTIKELS